MVVADGLLRADHQDQQIVGRSIASFHSHSLSYFRARFWELRFNALEVFEDACSTFRDEERFDVVAFFAGEFADVRNANGDYGQVLVDGQRFQIGWHETIAYIGEGRNRQVGLVDAILTDGIVEVHARERSFDLVSGGFEGCGQETFYRLPNSLGLWIAHFWVDLGELGLTVGAEIFVAEAAHDLKISVEAGDH